MKKFLQRGSLVVSIVLALFATTSPTATALDLPAWSDDSSGADTEPATTIATVTVPQSTTPIFDASEDGTVLAAIWSVSASGKSRAHAAVGWSNGATIKWSSATMLNANQTQNANHLSMSISGDGRTVYATWIESNGSNDDVRIAIGAVSIDPTTNTPSVTWGATSTFAVAEHQSYPAIDSNYDGTKVLLTYWSYAGASWYYDARVASVVISSSSRAPTWKGPATISIANSGYTAYLPRLETKISRDGTKGVVAWFDPSGLNTGFGKVQVSVGNFANLAFPASLNGSEWSAATRLSTGNEADFNFGTRNGMPSLDLDDAGRRAVVSWQGINGANNYVSARVGTITGATSSTWSPEVQLASNLATSGTRTKTSISADGTRVFAAWGTAGPTGVHGAAVGLVDANGTPTWSAADTVQAGAGNDGYMGAGMSRDGTTAVVLPLTRVSGVTTFSAIATDIWMDGGQLHTDWGTQLTTLSGAGSIPARSILQAAPAATLAKDGSVIVAYWPGDAGDPSLFSRATSIPRPSATLVSPDSGDIAGGTTITITGTNFRRGITATVGGDPCTNLVRVSATELRCTTPAHTVGATDVIVTNDNGSSATISDGFTYTSSPSTPDNSTPNNPTPDNSTPDKSSSPPDPSSPTATTTPTTGSTTTTSAPTLETTAEAKTPRQSIVVPNAQILRNFSTSRLAPSTALVAGAPVSIEAEGFTPNETVVVGIAEMRRSAGAVIASSSGRISARVAVPTAARGEVTIYAMGLTSKRGVKQVIPVELPNTGSETGTAVIALGVLLLGAFVSIAAARRRQLGHHHG